jgi:hypothetical protein
MFSAFSNVGNFRCQFQAIRAGALVLFVRNSQVTTLGADEPSVCMTNHPTELQVIDAVRAPNYGLGHLRLCFLAPSRLMQDAVTGV